MPLKKLLSLVLLLASFVCIAPAPATASPPIVVKKLFVINDVGNTLAGVLTMPGDYATTTDSLAVFYFYHGTGEAGDGTLGTVEKIYANGSPVGLAANGTDLTYTSPLNGRVYRFATFGLQGIQSWCADAPSGYYALTHDVLKNYRIARNYVFMGGLSAGGQVTWEAITHSATADVYAAAVPMSTPPPGLGTISTVISNKIHVWAFHGQLDGPPHDYTESVKLVNQCNAAQPGTARLTSYNVGHCCWATYWDPGYREPVVYYLNGVKKTQPLNVYEFCLLFAKGSTATLDTAKVATPIPGYDTTKASCTATVVGTSIQLDGSGTHSGAYGVGSWWYDYSAPAGVPKPLWSDGHSDGGATFYVKTLLNCGPGLWTFTLSTQDRAGNISHATCTATMPGSVVIVPPPTAKTIRLVSTTLVGGLISVTISWSDGTTTTLQ